MGVVEVRDAQNLAFERGMDLVEVDGNAKPPVCHIMDYGKFQYDQEKKKKRLKANSPKTETKEVRLSAVTGDHDIEIKVKQVRKFLEQGKHVKLTVMYRRRQIAHVDLGQKVLLDMLEAVKDIGKTDSKPRLEGKKLSVQVVPK